jgi:hypothetical protein
VFRRIRVSSGAVIDRDRNEPACDRRRRAAAAREIGDVERDGFRFSGMRHPANEACEVAEVPPIVAIRAFRRLCATGVSRRASSGPELGNERIDVAGLLDLTGRTGAPCECGALRRLHEARQRQDGHTNTRSTPVIFEPGHAGILACEKRGRLPNVGRSA